MCIIGIVPAHFFFTVLRLIFQKETSCLDITNKVDFVLKVCVYFLL